MATAAVDRRPRARPLTRVPRIAPALAVVGALIGLHLWLSSSMDDPLISDGAAYLANAAWIGGDGGEWFMGRTGFYHAGYSLLLAPLFAVSDDPVWIFDAVLVVNAIVSSLAFVAYLALARAVGLRSHLGMLAAAVAAVYPAVLLQASIEWSDNLYHLVFALLLVALARVVTTARIVAGVALGAAGAFLYAVHPRALGALPVLGIALVLLAWRRPKTRRAAAAAVATLAVGFVVVRLGHGVLIDAMWAPDRAATEGDILKRLTDPTLLKGVVLRLIGHSWYLLVASFGVVAAAIVWLARRWRDPFALATVALCVGTMGAGALMMSDATRVDHFVYGRYNEGFLPALLVIGIAGLAELRRARSLALLTGAAIAGIAALGALTVATNGGDVFTGNVMPLNVLGILAWETSRSHIDIAVVSLIAAGITVVVLLAGIRSAALAAVLLVAAFTGESVRARWNVVDPWSDFFSNVSELPEAAAVLPTDERVTYDRAGYFADAAIFYQFELLDRGVTFWDADEGEEPATDLVISRREWPEAEALGARMIFPERFYQQALWVLPGALADDLVARGFAFDERIGEIMPKDELHGGMGAPPEVEYRAGETVVVPIDVHHPGMGGPWAGLQDLPQEQGSVRLLAEWSDGRTAGIGDLPKVLLPGQRARVNVILPVPDEPGRYDLTLRLLQVGGGPMTGGRVVSVDVR